MRINLGDKVRDSITGLVGIAVARTEWLQGCVRVVVQPQELKDGKPVETSCFDEPQLVVQATAEKLAQVQETVERKARKKPTGGTRGAEDIKAAQR